jgi:phosphatidylglycerol lysyltransferase
MTRVESAAERRQRLVDTHAYNGLALLTLYDGWRYFEPTGHDGFVAFELHRGTAVACGDPVCAEADLPELLSLFARYCAGHRWRFAFVGASARLGKIAAGMGLNAVKIGEEPFFDLSTHSLTGKGAKKARSAINLARRTGVMVEEYATPSPAIDTEIGEISREWLEARNAPPMGFLLRSRPLVERERKRIFIATHEGRTVAALTCAPAPARNLLYVEEQLRRPDAPYGTSELLIEEARRVAKEEGIALLSLGTAPLEGATRQPHGSHRRLSWLFRALCTKFNFVYSFRSLNHFKRKFAPTFWEDNFLVFQGALSLTAISVISAFAPDGIPSLILPKKLQWLRLVPAAAVWTGALAGVVVAAFTAWQFPELVIPFRLGLRAFLLAFVPADLVFDRAQVAVLAHRIISAVVLLALGAAVWQRRARA